MNIYILASGSKGNSIIIEDNNNYLAIDLGISFKKYIEKLEELGIDPNNIKDYIITHEHQDHTKGLKGLIKRCEGNNFYLTKGTNRILKKDNMELTNITYLKYDEPVKILNYEVFPLEISHDAAEPIGLIIKTEDKKIAIITDSGYIPNIYDEKLKNLDAYLFEANHDIPMLMKSPRPHQLKTRIISESGHMSNDYITEKLDRLIDDKSIWVVCHISEDCNTVDKIEEAIVKNFSNPFKLKEIHYTSQETKVVTV